MSAALLAQSLAPIALAMGVPVPTVTPALDLPDHRFDLGRMARNERNAPPTTADTQAVPALDAGQFPAGFEPPSRTWTLNGGAQVELGALSSKRYNAPDVVHLTLGFDF